jgi:ribosomal protein S18 acetylase RimI-like enzyme
MRRRPVRFWQDYEQLLAMQRLSWQINFPRHIFSEALFRGSLRDGARRGEVFVYEADQPEEEIVGWLWLDFSDPEIVHIRHIQVEQAYWGRGLGRAILEDAIALCTAQGYRAITLNVTKSNARAMALYAHLGFVVEEDNQERQFMRLELPSGRAATAPGPS